MLGPCKAFLLLKKYAENRGGVDFKKFLAPERVFYVEMAVRKNEIRL